MHILIKKRKLSVQFCRGFAAALGFMFHFSSDYAKVLAFKKEQKISLHMFFVFFPLLAVFLDKNKRIVEIKKLLPFTFYNCGKMAKYVVEVPYPLASKFKVRFGDKIKFLR